MGSGVCSVWMPEKDMGPPVTLGAHDSSRSQPFGRGRSGGSAAAGEQADQAQAGEAHRPGGRFWHGSEVQADGVCGEVVIATQFIDAHFDLEMHLTALPWGQEAQEHRCVRWIAGQVGRIALHAKASALPNQLRTPQTVDALKKALNASF